MTGSSHTPYQVGLAVATLSAALATTFISSPAMAASPASKPARVSQQIIERLMTMFSPEIQQTIGACREQGKVNLEAGADRDGSVICGDGSTDSPVQYSEYLSTFSDVLAASGLIGLRTALKSNPQVRPEMIIAALNTPNGTKALRKELRKYIIQGELVPQNSTRSADLLVDQVMPKIQPVVKNPRTFEALLGTKTQYAKVVGSFCNPPGIPVNQAKSLVPELSLVHFYAICIEDSGLAEEIQTQLSR